MTNTAANTAADLIARFTADADALDAALAPTPGCTVIEGEAWIILDGACAVAFDVTPEGRKFRAVSKGYTLAHRANRFTEADARTLAGACDAWTAVRWRDAAAATRDTLRAHVATLTAAIAWHQPGRHRAAPSPATRKAETMQSKMTPFQYQAARARIEADRDRAIQESKAAARPRADRDAIRARARRDLCALDRDAGF